MSLSFWPTQPKAQPLAQPEDIFVISTYDYQQALQESLNHPAQGSDEHPYSFLHVRVNQDRTFSVREVGNYVEGIQSTYKRRNTLLFVHGDGANLNELIPEMCQVPELYDVNLILFVWPAQEVRNGIRNYYQAKQNATFVFDSFIHTINHIRGCDSIAQGNITLMFHSLGNLFAKQYAHYIVNEPRPGMMFDNIILNAPAVPTEDHELWADIMAHRARNGVYLNFNGNDRTLKALDTYLEHQPLLGRSPAPPYANRITYVNFSDLLKDATGYEDTHTYFIDTVAGNNEGVKGYYKTVMNGLTPGMGDRYPLRRDNDIPAMFHCGK